MSGTSKTVSQVSVWFFRIALPLSFIWYLLLFIVGCIFIVNIPAHKAYQYFMQTLAAANGLFAVYLTGRKVLLGPVWAVVALVFITLAALEVRFSMREGETGMLIFTIPVVILLFSQIPYLKKLQKIPEKGFRNAQFASGASFSDEELAGLYSAWFAHNRAVAVFTAALVLAAFHGLFLSYALGGFIGNMLGVALLFGVLILALIVIRPRKKRYQAYRDKLGLTDKDVQQAMRHRKRGTVADGN